MDKVLSPSINAFRKLSDIASLDPVELSRTNEDLQARIIEQNRLILELSESGNHTEELERLRAQVRDYSKEISKLKENNRELIRQLNLNSPVDITEHNKIKNELAQLKSRQQIIIRAERSAEREKLQGEFTLQVESWQKMFTCLEKISTKTLATLADHESDEEVAKIARRLRTLPGDLRSSLAMDEISYQSAFDELAPVLYAAAAKITTFKKLALPTTRVEHRARILLIILPEMKEITTAQAESIIAGDEGKIPKNLVILRAMKKAAILEPTKCLFFNGSQDGTLSKLKWFGGDTQ